MGSPWKDSDESPESSDRRIETDPTDESGEMDCSGSPESSDAAGGLVGRPEDACQRESNAGSVPERRDGENWAVQWLRALNLQALGACRADERLNPLLKLNASSGTTEDQLIMQLSQHFEVSEIGMLARCLCVPLVSIRVGKIEKHGALLHSTSVRSNLHLAFAGDDGQTERLALVSNDSKGFEVTIEEISADRSGRSFLINLLESQVSYYWCSEKSLPHELELLAKMKDLLVSRPTLSDLTGISEARLDAFAAHLGSYFVGLNNGELKLPTPLIAHCDSSLLKPSQSSSMISKSSRCHLAAAHAASLSPVCQASLSPRSNTFKDGAPRTSSCTRSGAHDKLKRRGECSFNTPSISSLPNYSASLPTCPALSTSAPESAPLALPSASLPFPSLDPRNIESPKADVVQNSVFKPYYGWCPPCTSSLQHKVTPPHLPSLLPESLSLPPLTVLFSAAGSSVSMVPPKLAADAANLPSMNLPLLLHDPPVRLPLAVPSIAPLTSSQVPTFTPWMSDPIVHTPVIDVCSSGQAYLVSAGPAISSIAPLVPSLVVKPLTPETESEIERNARETLRRLIASTPTFGTLQSMSLAPTLGNVDGNVYGPNVNKQDIHCGDQLNGASGISCMVPCSPNEEAADGDDGNKVTTKDHDDTDDDCEPVHLRWSS